MINININQKSECLFQNNAASAINSLQQAIQKTEKESHAFEADYLQGVAGLTGICAGFAVKCPALVSAYKHLDTISLPPKVKEEYKHLQKNLLLAIYRTPSLDHNPTIQEFARIISEETNVALESVGKPVSQEERNSALDLLFKEQSVGDEGHYLFFVIKPGDAIQNGHVFYVNLEHGIIGDANFGMLLWKIPHAYKTHFKEVVANHLKQYYDKNQLTLCKIKEKTPTSFSKIPLLARRVIRRMETATRIAHQKGFLMAGKFICSLNPLVKKLFKLGIVKLTKEKFEDELEMMKDFSLIEKLRSIKKLQKISPTSLKKNPFLEHFCAKTPNNDEWPQILEFVKTLDPNCPFSTYVQEALLEAAINPYSYQFQRRSDDQIHYLSEKVLPELLALRKKLKIAYSLDELMHRILFWNMHPKLLKPLLEEGANPNYCSKNGDPCSLPLYKACRKGGIASVTLLLEFGAFPDHKKFTGKENPLKVLHDSPHPAEVKIRIENLLQKSINASRQHGALFDNLAHA